MVQMKLDMTGVDPTKSNGFEPYEGPLPSPGIYAATLQTIRVRISGNGNPYFNVGYLFGDQNSEAKQKVKGYMQWDKVTPGESDFQKERVGKLLYAICGKVKANVVHEEVTDGGLVTKVGAKEPVGTRVKVVIRRSSYNGEPTTEVTDLFPWPKDEPWPTGDAEASDDDTEVEVEADEEPEPDEDEPEPEDVAEEDEPEDEDDEFESRQAELAGMDRAAVKAVLKTVDPSFKVLKRHTDDELREAVLDVEFPPEDSDEEEGDDGPPF